MKQSNQHHGRSFRARIVLSILTTLFSSSMVLAADDKDGDQGWFVPKGTAAKNFYAGAKLGVDKSDFPKSNQDGSVTGVRTDKTGTGKGLTLGYQINENLAIEGGYRDFGKSDFRGTSSGGPSWLAGPVRATNESDAWELGVLGRWQIAPRWYALGFLGWSWWESKETYVESGFKSEEKDSGGDAVYAIGLEYDPGLKDRIVYRFMGARRDVDDSGYEIDSATAEIVYRFP